MYSPDWGSFCGASIRPAAFATCGDLRGGRVVKGATVDHLYDHAVMEACSRGRVT